MLKHQSAAACNFFSRSSNTDNQSLLASRQSTVPFRLLTLLIESLHSSYFRFTSWQKSLFFVAKRDRNCENFMNIRILYRSCYTNKSDLVIPFSPNVSEKYSRSKTRETEQGCREKVIPTWNYECNWCEHGYIMWEKHMHTLHQTAADWDFNSLQTWVIPLLIVN